MILLAALVALSSSAAPLKVGVTDFTATQELQPLAAALNGTVANELHRMGAFDVTTTEQLRQLLSLERQQQLLGCADDSCRTGAVANLGFDFLISGGLTRLAGSKDKPGTLSLELLMMEVKTGKREASDVVTAANEAELVGRVSPSVAKLVGRILKDRSGSLVVLASEAGAVVKVDDIAVGTTPLEGRLQVPGGPHYLKLEKEGFVTREKEVRIAPDQVTEESVRLVPSPDYIANYESTQRKLRIGAWGATGLAVASLAAAVVFEVRAQQLYGPAEKSGTFLFYRAEVASGIEDHRKELNELKTQVGASQTLGAVFFGVAAVGAAGAAALWLIGEDPSRYGAYREVGLKASAAPLPGGGMAGLSGGF